MNIERDNFKAGLFVIVGVVLSVVVIVMLSDFRSWFQKNQTVKVWYPLSEGIQGLKVGATVTLGDEPVGKVKKIENLYDPENPGRVYRKVVVMDLPASLKIYRGASFDIKPVLIGGGTKINISDVGNEKDGLYVYKPELKPDDEANILPPPQVVLSDIMRQFGLKRRDVERIPRMLENLEEVTKNLRQEIPELVRKGNVALDDVVAMAAKLRGASNDVALLLTSVRGKSDIWLPQVDRVLDNIDATTAALAKLIKEKQEAVSKTVDDLAAIMSTVRHETLKDVTEALKSARGAMDEANKALKEVNNILITQRPAIESVMANFKIASDQLKLAMIEVRRSPWRLLYSPSEKELEYDNLYDAARSFALAASTLETTMAGLRNMTVKNPEDQAEIDRMLEHLKLTFDKYKEIEGTFWDALGGKKLNFNAPTTQPAAPTGAKQPR